MRFGSICATAQAGSARAMHHGRAGCVSLPVAATRFGEAIAPAKPIHRRLGRKTYVLIGELRHELLRRNAVGQDGEHTDLFGL